MAVNRNKGFALLIAVIFASVMLAIGTSLGSLGYKQQILSSSAARSQYAIYAAQAALECTMFQLQKTGNAAPYLYNNRAHFFPTDDFQVARPTCGTPSTEGQSPTPVYNFTEVCYNTSDCPNQWVTRKRFELAYPSHDSVAVLSRGTGLLCADVQVYTELNLAPGTTYVHATGYDVPCSKVANNSRVVTRGLLGSF